MLCCSPHLYRGQRLRTEIYIGRPGPVETIVVARAEQAVDRHCAKAVSNHPILGALKGLNVHMLHVRELRWLSPEMDCSAHGCTCPRIITRVLHWLIRGTRTLVTKRESVRSQSQPQPCVSFRPHSASPMRTINSQPDTVSLHCIFYHYHKE